MIIKIKDLRLRAILGINDWEREKKQDLIINAVIETDNEKSAETDDIKDSIDYKKVTKRIIALVENSQFFLIERLAGKVLDVIFESVKVKSAKVEIDKPHALRFADSVSVTLSRKNE